MMHRSPLRRSGSVVRRLGLGVVSSASDVQFGLAAVQPGVAAGSRRGGLRRTARPAPGHVHQRLHGRRTDGRIARALHGSGFGHATSAAGRRQSIPGRRQTPRRGDQLERAIAPDAHRSVSRGPVVVHRILDAHWRSPVSQCQWTSTGRSHYFLFFYF